MSPPTCGTLPWSGKLVTPVTNAKLANDAERAGLAFDLHPATTAMTPGKSNSAAPRLRFMGILPPALRTTVERPCARLVTRRASRYDRPLLGTRPLPAV